MSGAPESLSRSAIRRFQHAGGYFSVDIGEHHFLDLIEKEKKKMCPDLTGDEIDRIENEILRLQGLLERNRQETLQKGS